MEQELIDPIRWREVAGWELWGSLEKVGRPIQSGTSSEPLLDLPPFPRKSLLVLIRRPLPPNTTSSSSSSPAASSLPSYRPRIVSPCYPSILQLPSSLVSCGV